MIDSEVLLHWLPYAPLPLAILGFAMWGVGAMRTRGMARDIGEALRMPDITLSDVPGEIRRIELLMADMNTELKTSRQELRAVATARLPATVPGPNIRRATAIALCFQDALAKADKLDHDAEFRRVRTALRLDEGLSGCIQALGEIGDESMFRRRLTDALAQSRFDLALTASDFFAAYFPSNEAWQPLKMQMEAGKISLEALLGNFGITLYPTLFLTTVSHRDIRGLIQADIREFRRIAAVQERAARKARDLNDQEVLVVDCHRPGWYAKDKGTEVKPLVAIFDRSTWT